MLTLSKSLSRRLSKELNKVNCPIAYKSISLALAKGFSLKISIVSTVEKEVYKVRDYCLSAFIFKELYNTVICTWKEFNKDFSYDTYLGLRKSFYTRQSIKVLYNLLAVSVKGYHRSLFKTFYTFFLPLPVQLVSRAFYKLIRPGCI